MDALIPHGEMETHNIEGLPLASYLHSSAIDNQQLDAPSASINDKTSVPQLL